MASARPYMLTAWLSFAATQATVSSIRPASASRIQTRPTLAWVSRTANAGLPSSVSSSRMSSGSKALQGSTRWTCKRESHVGEMRDSSSSIGRTVSRVRFPVTAGRK